MERYKKYQEWYRTELDKPRSVSYMLKLTVLMCIVGAAVGFGLKECHKKPEPVTKAHYTEQEQKYIKVFTKYGSPDPQAMACAVTKTKKPALMAALAIRESNGNPHAVGDGSQSIGAFQVQPKHWQPVPATATEQAQQAERILDELVAASPRGSLLQALSRYNSGKPASRAGRRYAARVLELTKKIERG